MILTRADFYDAELRSHNEHLCAAARVGPHDEVLDIGCGAGKTSHDAARIAVHGGVLGIDVSSSMLEVAQHRSAEEGLGNVRFEKGDAQTHELPLTRFDLCISRFGVMFFADPVAAFTNIGQAMRPGARLVWMVWQNRDQNEWATAIARALASEGTATSESGAAFSLGNPKTTTNYLTAAGFTSTDFAEVREPVYYGADVDTAYDALIGLNLVSAGSASDAALCRLRGLLRAHSTADGVLFDSRAWIVTARRACA